MQLCRFVCEKLTTMLDVFFDTQNGEKKAQFRRKIGKKAENFNFSVFLFRRFL